MQQPLEREITAEQVRVHYEQIPVMAIAPTAGGLFTSWVLWNAVPNTYLLTGMSAVVAIALLRLWLYRWYFRSQPQQAHAFRWRCIAVVSAFVSGSIWGSGAFFLYPPLIPGYEVFVLVLLSLVPIVPVAAMAVYMPAFYAYYVPCITPFIVMLGLQESRPERMTALLLLTMVGATLTFAHRFSRHFSEAVKLKLQLAQQTNALEQSARHRIRFLAGASHDLRQPVHAMGLQLELLHSHAQERHQIELLRHLDAGLQSLRAMLNDLMDLSRLDADLVKVNRREFAASELCRKLHVEYALLAAAKGLRMRFFCQNALVNSDPVLLERMLRNLLSNALRYTIRGGILLACRARHGHILLQVYDTGVGIEEKQLPNVFQEFTRLHHPTLPSAQGLGLGLTIVKRLARLLDHKLLVRSRLGKGSVFNIEITQAHVGAQQPALTEVWPQPAPAAAGLVLIVDDDPQIAAATGELVRRWGHNTVVAETPQSAWQALTARGASPDLIIIDFRLAAGETAPAAIGYLNEKLGKSAPVIIVTGDTAPERVLEAYAAGYVLLHKPVDPQRLKICIASLLQAEN